MPCRDHLLDVVIAHAGMIAPGDYRIAHKSSIGLRTVVGVIIAEPIQLLAGKLAHRLVEVPVHAFAFHANRHGKQQQYTHYYI